jgi:hypothetical protein
MHFTSMCRLSFKTVLRNAKLIFIALSVAFFMSENFVKAVIPYAIQAVKHGRVR